MEGMNLPTHCGLDGTPSTGRLLHNCPLYGSGLRAPWRMSATHDRG